MGESRYLLVDGHSVIFALPVLRQLHQRRPAQAREELIKWLQMLHDAGPWLVTVVFDGRFGTVDPRNHRDMVVSYSQEGETADSIIEKMTGLPGLAPQITVVTADHAEQNIVESLGASSVSPEWLQLEIESKRQEMSTRLNQVHRKAKW